MHKVLHFPPGVDTFYWKPVEKKLPELLLLVLKAPLGLSSIHFVKSILGMTPLLHGTLGLILWSGRTKARIWTVSSLSVLSQSSLAMV